MLDVTPRGQGYRIDVTSLPERWCGMMIDAPAVIQVERGREDGRVTWSGAP